jgi:hypothetical protein
MKDNVQKGMPFKQMIKKTHLVFSLIVLLLCFTTGIMTELLSTIIIVITELPV